MKIQSSCICINLRRVSRLVTQCYDDALADAGIKITQFSLLREIGRSEPVALSKLADAVELDRTTLARNLAPLERDGFVVLTAGEDQRVTQIGLTRSGRAVIAKAMPLWERAQREIGARLSDEKLGQLKALTSELSVAASTRIATPKASKMKPARRAAK